MCYNSYNLLRAIVTLCLVGASGLDVSWEKELFHCEDENTRPPTLEDISMFVQDSWIYAALISLPEGNGNYTDTCQICDDGIVFNRNKASIKPQLEMMFLVWESRYRNLDTSVFETTACYQASTLIPSCLPLPLEKNNHWNFREDCTVSRLFQEFNVYAVSLVGAVFIYGMINIIFIMCTVKYLIKKLTNRVSSEDQNSSPNTMEPKIRVYYRHL